MRRDDGKAARRQGRFIATVVAVLLISGCSMTGPNRTLPPTSTAVRWETAKETTQAEELAIAHQIDPAEVTSVSQNPKGTLMQCDAKTWQWTGHTAVGMKNPANMSAVLASARSYWSSQPGFTVTSEKDTNGSPVLDIARGDHEGYAVGPGSDGKSLWIDSYSDCFTVPDDVYPGGRF